MVMSFQDYVQTLKPRVDDAFKRELSILLGEIEMSHPASLVAALESGKKIRGCLTCLVSDALGGVLEFAIPRAVAVELIQAATLIHDDFVDQDIMRRNMPATWTLEGARRAVLIGDVIFATAIKMMNDLGREDGMAASYAIAEISKGALHEPLQATVLMREIESDRLDVKLYEKIIHLKTGILFGMACRLGAISAESNGRLRQMSYRYGLRIGEAYQIADDLKEVRKHLLSRSIHPGQMAALVPTFLHFLPEMRPYLSPILKGECRDLGDPLLEYFNMAAKLMEKEIETRLKAALSEIAEGFPSNEYSALAREAPRDLVRMFNVNET